ncbi:nuclear pore complex protein Nup214 isoform X2 [Hippocampus zosterae]|uniref:nuclear pore complex protein Nup214 isoform X2 n=1 Tax=Hippocampus zosterae TaxID=109293 RepID=UPI00223C9E0C|nr:nuclear pore complex protein Nup214 isoform X2 [Hippocampus zosterae]
MSDDTDSPPEREMKDFQFRQMKKAKVFQPSGEMPRERSSLLAVSNKFGLAFAGSGGMFKVYRTQDILAADKQDGNSNTIVEGISALVEVRVDSTLHNLALNSDELTLSVCAVSGEATLFVSFYDVRTFVNQARAQKFPFASWQPTVPPETLVLDLKWNPVQASMLAVCLSDGSMSVLDVADDVRVQAALPASSGVTCLCWSPKGKQVAVGKMNGTVSQYTPALEEKKVIPCPHFYTSDDPVKVLDVLWLRTFSFAVVYAAADGSPETPPELVLITIPKKDEKVETKYLNFSDTVYGCCTERQHHYFLSHIEDWNLLLAASAASIEVSVIARQDDKIWELWMLEDASRAELPVSETSEDTLPLGLAIDYTSQQEIRISDEKTLPPAPTLLMLSTEGLLCPFALLNLNAGVKQLIATCAALTTEGERPPKPVSLAMQSSKSAAPLPSAIPNLAVTSVAASSSAAPPFSLVAPAPSSSSSSSAFTFSLPSVSGNSAPPAFSLGSSAAPFGSGASGFAFGSAKSPSEAPSAPSAFSFSTPSNKVTASMPQNLTTPSVPAAKLNLSDRFSAVEAPAAPPPSFSFATPMTKGVVSNGSVPALAAAAATTKPATVSTPVRPVQTSIPPAALQKPSPALQGRIQTPQAAAVGVKPVEKQQQQQQQQPQPKKETDPIMTGILEEISHFQKELEDFKARSSVADFKVGTNEEMKELRKESEDLNIFTLEIKETTESLHSDIGTLKTTLLEGFAGAEEAKSQSDLSRDRNYRQLLYKRPLDPRSEEQLKEIRRLYQYVMFAVEDVNDVLDVEWEKHLEKKKKKKHMLVPGREGLFTTLANNLYIINQQKNRLDQLVNKLTSLHLYSKTDTPTATRNAANSGSMESELDSLRDALMKARLDTTSPKAKRPSPVKISPVKQSQLRNFLSKGHMPPVRSTAPANLSRSAFLSPKYFEDLDNVSSSSSLSQSMEPHLPHLEVEEEEEEEEELQQEHLPIATATPSYPRHPTVVRTPSIQPGFGAIQSTPLGKMQSVPGMGFRLSPIASPIPTNKINLSGADSTALATKTVKHGAPPAERTVPVTIPAQQAAASAALRRLMANQKTAVVNTSLTESTLKTVPQVVNVQELKDKGALVSTPTINSSSTADSAAVPLHVAASSASILPKRNPGQGVQKPSNGSTSVPQASFMFGQSDSAVAPSNSAESSVSKGFSFTSTPSSFSFSSVTPAAGIPPAKDVSEFSFGGNGKMIFGQTVEEPSKPPSPSLTFTVSATQAASSEAPVPVSSSISTQPQLPKMTGGETLGSFSGLRVGQGEEAKDSSNKSTPANTAFTFGGTAIGKGTAQFSFGSDQKSAGDSLGADLSKSGSLFKPPEANPKLTFCVTTSNTPASALHTSFSSLLAAPAEVTEDPKPTPQPSEPPPSHVKDPSPEPSVESITPVETPKPLPDAAIVKDPDPVPQASVSVPATEATTLAPITAADTAQDVTSGAPVIPVPQAASPAFQAPTSEKPGSIFTQPTTTESGSTAVTPAPAVNATAGPEAVAASTHEAAIPTFAVTTTTSVGTVFGQPAAAPPVSAAPSVFGSSAFGTSTGGGFGKSVFGQPSGFGQPASNNTTPSGFSFGQSAFGASASAVTTGGGGGGLFGVPTPGNASSFSFGASTNASTSSGTSTGLFGQSTTSAFGQISTFGQASLFGSNTTTSSSTGFSFGQPSGFGSSAPSGFGQQANTGSVFGQPQQPSGGGLFGSSAANPAGPSGGSLFSGLGGKPSEDAVNKNPFGPTASAGGFGQPAQTGAPGLFGSTVAKPIGFGQASFGEQKSSGTFSSGAGSVASQGFGSFASPTKPGAFGSAPVFGSPPAFGTSPSFGASAAFGTSPSFSNAMGSSAGKVFGEGTAASSMGGFGFASPSSASSFGALANQSAPPSFGGLAQQGPGFGAQPGGFAGFGQQPQPGGFSGNAFGSTNQSNSQTFAGWRS